MSVSQFRVTCDSYKNNICFGFSVLQQNQEFVDMTIAAEGHFVKVHQNLLALCSPYIKELLKSIPGQHPVIILNNVSYEILCIILEYIYTGEVQVPSEKLEQFFKAANNLHLCGIDNLEALKTFNDFEDSSTNEPNRQTSNTTYASVLPHITINPTYCNLEDNAVDRQDIIRQNVDKQDVERQDLNYTKFLENTVEGVEATSEDVPFGQNTTLTSNNVKRREANDQEISNLQYTVSNKGSLQIILNRYIYNMHHQAHGGRRVRWRCIDYRSLHCPAFVDTDNDVIINRKFIHSHPFHDNKILKKVQRSLIFSTTAKALSKQRKERETHEDNMDESD